MFSRRSIVIITAVQSLNLIFFGFDNLALSSFSFKTSVDHVASTGAKIMSVPTFSLDDHRLPRTRYEAGKSQFELRNYWQQHPNSFFRHDFYYAAAWLTSLQTFMTNPDFFGERLNVTSLNSNLERGTFAAMSKDRMTFRTFDFFDFFVHHLSRYKSRHHRTPQNWQLSIDNMVQMEQDYIQDGYNNPNREKNGKVLALIPYHGNSDNHSRQDERQLSLNITVKTVARVFPNIVLAVCDQANYDFVTKQSGLQDYFYDVLHVTGLTTCVHLPHMSSVRARDEIRKGSWVGFEWIYYTESDQIPHLKNVNLLLSQALKTKAVVVPHRSFPTPLAQDFNETAIHDKSRSYFDLMANKTVYSVDDLAKKSCCIPRNETYKDHGEQWDFGSPSVALFKQRRSHAQVLGSCNNFKLKCFVCLMQDGPRACDNQYYQKKYPQLRTMPGANNVSMP